MTIEQIHEEIIDEFSVFDDWMDKYQLLIDMGNALPALEDEYKTDQNLIEGCQSRVWLHADYADGIVPYKAESDAIVVLPGGAGTMDEFLDAYVSRKLGYIKAPIIVCNKAGFFNPLLAQLERCYAERFASPLEVGMYQVADDATDCCYILSRLFPALKDINYEKK